MSEVRKEKRNPERLQLLISRTADPLFIEPASTACMLTERPWKRDIHVIVQSSEYELWARARVIYCQALPDKTFAIGLQLLARTGDWIMRSSV